MFQAPLASSQGVARRTVLRPAQPRPTGHVPILRQSRRTCSAPVSRELRKPTRPPIGALSLFGNCCLLVLQNKKTAPKAAYPFPLLVFLCLAARYQLQLLR